MWPVRSRESRSTSSDATGAIVALFGVPLEGDDTLAVTLLLSRGDRMDTSEVRLVVRQPGYPREQITVPPRMVEYDSATSARIESEGLRAREVSRRSHDTPRLWSLPLRLPRPGRITSRLRGRTGIQREGDQPPHWAPTSRVRSARRSRAPTRGVVALVADFYLAGKAVYVDHGAGLVTGYFHLSRADVAVGDTVSAGQRIGAVGRSGRVTGPHLHWIMRYGAISVDPMSLVKLGKSLSP